MIDPIIVVYPTSESILTVFDGDKQDILLISGRIQNSNCWGFSESDSIHLYFNKSATFYELLNLVMHELTHINYSMCQGDEEDVCCNVGELCCLAAEITKKIMPL